LVAGSPAERLGDAIWQGYNDRVFFQQLSAQQLKDRPIAEDQDADRNTSVKQCPFLFYRIHLHTIDDHPR